MYTRVEPILVHAQERRLLVKAAKLACDAAIEAGSVRWFSISLDTTLAREVDAMRVLVSALLATILLAPASASADTLDHFSITGSGLDVEFSLPQSTTVQYFGRNYNFLTSGTANGVSEPIVMGIIFPGLCAVCDTLQLTFGSTSLFLDLPDFYQISTNGMYPNASETLDFLPGTYRTSLEYPRGGPDYNVDITQGASATPEPSSFALLGTGLLGVAGVVRKRIGSAGSFFENCGFRGD